MTNPLALCASTTRITRKRTPCELPEAKALQRLPGQAAVDAFVRKNASTDTDTGADVWTVGVLRHVTAVDPGVGLGMPSLAR